MSGRDKVGRSFRVQCFPRRRCALAPASVQEVAAKIFNCILGDIIDASCSLLSDMIQIHLERQRMLM